MTNVFLVYLGDYQGNIVSPPEVLLRGFNPRFFVTKPESTKIFYLP